MGAEERHYYSTASTFSFPSGVAETTILTISPSQNMGFKGIYLDLVNLTQDAIIRIKHDINNNSSFITFETHYYDVGISINSVLIGRKLPINNDIRITIQSVIAEGASRNIPHEYFFIDISNVNA